MISFTLGLIFLDGWTEFLSVLAGMIELAYVVSWLNWRKDTKEMPKMHYRAFRRIERIAPEKWEPMSYLGSYGTETHILGTVHYDISGHCKVWETICMKTFPEALIFEVGYKRRYRKRKLDRKKNYVIERCIESWKKDLEDYRNKADQDRLKAMTELRMKCSSLSKDELDRLKSIGNGQSKMPDLFSMDDESLYKDRRFWESCAEYVSGGKYGTDDN